MTAIEFRLYPIPDVYAGMLLWDRERAPEVVRAWAQWSRTAPDAVTTSLRVMSLPPLPELPPFLRGRQLVVMDGAVLADDASAEALLAPLRALGPEMDTFARVPSASLTRLHMDPEAGVVGIEVRLLHFAARHPATSPFHAGKCFLHDGKQAGR